MNLVVRAMNYPLFHAFIVRLNQVRQIIANGGERGVTMVGAVAHRITAIYRRAVVIKQKLAEPRPDRGAPGLRFWLILFWQTFRQRDILPLSRAMLDPYQAQGLENIPADGVFTLAVNHTNRRWLPHLMASVHQATIEKRPELAREWLVIVGFRRAKIEGRPAWQRGLILTIRRFFDQMWERWSYNSIRLPMADRDKDSVKLDALRQWRQRSKNQPSIVFPEGRAAPLFENIRPGAGRWLAGLDVPVLPVSAWWEEDQARWQIVFGPAIRWSKNPRLHDLQVGLEIAYALPPEQAPEWQADLDAWREAHQPTPEEVATPDFA